MQLNTTMEKTCRERHVGWFIFHHELTVTYEFLAFFEHVAHGHTCTNKHRCGWGSGAGTKIKAVSNGLIGLDH